MTLKILRKKILLPLILAFALILLIVSIQATLQRILPPHTITNWVARIMEEKLSVQTSIEDVSLSVIPCPSIRMHNIRFSDLKTGTDWIRAESLEVKLKFFPLILGKALAYKIYLNRPEILVRRDEHGKWLFMGHSPAAPAEHEIKENGSALSLQTTIKSIFFKDASFVIMDQRDPSGRPHLVLQEVYGSLRRTSGEAPIQLRVKAQFPHRLLELNSFSMNGEIDLGAGPWDLRYLKLNADLAISRMPAKISSPYLLEFLGIQQISGETGLKAHCTLNPDNELDMSGELSLENFHFLADRYATQPLKGKEAVVSFSLHRGEGIVSVNHLDLRLGEISAWGHGIWTGDLNGKPWYGISLHASNLSFDGLRGYLPDRLLSEDIARSVRNAVSTGSMDIPLLEITASGQSPSGTALKSAAGEGLAGYEKHFSIKVAFHDFGLKQGGNLLPLTSINGGISVDQESVQFMDMSGSYGNSDFKRITGTFSRTMAGETDLGIDAGLNLKEIQDLSMQLPEALRNTLPLSHIRQFVGYAGIQIRLLSSKSQNAPVSLQGIVDLDGAGFAFPLSPFSISGIQGRLNFKENEVLPFSLKAKIGNLPSLIEGMASRVASSDPYLRLKISANPTEQDLSSWFPLLSGILKISNENPGLTLLLDGTPGDMNIDTSLDLTRTSFTLSDWMSKTAGTSSRFAFTGHVLNGKQMIIRKGEWKLAGESLLFTGSVQDSEALSITLDIRNAAVSMQSLSQVFPVFSGSPPNASVSGDLTLSYRPKDKDPVDVKGDLVLNHVSAHPRISPWTFRNTAGTLHFAGQEVSAKGILCEWGNTPLSLDLKIPRMGSTEPELRIALHDLDLAPLEKEFFSADNTSQKIDRAAWKKPRFKADLTMDKVRYKQYELQDFLAGLIMKDGVLTIPSFTTSGLAGTATGKASVDFLSAETPVFQAETQIAGVSAEKYLQLFPGNRTFYAGEISGSIRVGGNFYKSLEETSREMTGGAHLLIRSTRERNYLFNLIKEIISRVEIMAGRKDELFLILEYDTMGGDFTIHDGKFHSTNFTIKHYNTFDVSGLTLDKLTAAVPIRVKYNIRAAGSYDFLSSDIDCYIMAQPFSLATYIVKKVPIAGKMLTGKDESLYAVYYHYTGLTSNTFRGKKEAARMKSTSFKEIPKPVRDTLIRQD
ncbi:MAG: AsmA family protein [bacterium]